MEERVSISISDGIADVRLVRADKMNALDHAMFEALVAATERLSKEKGVRVVVLSGEGRAFCAGLDMGRFAAMKEKGGNGIPGGENRDLTARTHGQANFRAAGGVGLAPASGAGDRRGARRRLRRRLPARARRRHALPLAGCADVGDGDQMGPGARHGGHADPGLLVRDDILRDLTYTGRIFSAQEAMATASPRASATTRARRRSRSRARSPARARMRSAPQSACSTISRSIPARRCSPSPSNSRS